MQSPRGKGRMLSREGNKGRNSASKQQEMSPRGRKLLGFRPKNMDDLKSGSHSPFQKHEHSFSSLYSKFMQHKTYGENHELGFSADQIKQAVGYIFKKYDTNRDNLLDRGEVRVLIGSSLLHMGQKHTPSQLEIIEFIYAMDKNNDGKLSRLELEKAFMRANRIEY